MKMEVPLRHMFSYPVDDIAALMPAVDDPVWERFEKRQKEYNVHRKTRSIGFIWTDGWVGSSPATFNLGYAPRALSEAALAAGQRIVAQFPGGTIARLMLTELPEGASIPRHKDGGAMMELTHRCHLPVQTNPGVHFMIDDVDHHLDVGEVYEVDNMRPHAVSNLGASRRVHLICNVLPAQTVS